MMNFYTTENLKEMFDILNRTKGVTQHEVHHPEGDVYTHSLMSFHIAMKETEDLDLIFAALLHDVGKAELPPDRRGGHEDYSAELIKGFSSTKTIFLVEQHMRVWTFIHGEMKRHGKMKFLLEHPWLPELIHLGRIDHIARFTGWRNPYASEDDIVDRINTKIARKYVGL